MGYHQRITQWLGWLCVILTLSLGAAKSQAEENAYTTIDTLEQLQKEITRIHEETGSTALGLAVVNRGELVWLDALGQANVEQNLPATPDSLFRIGSTSKMFAALAVLKLVDEGRLDLDTPLRELAPEVEFENPWEDEHPVRLVHLLEHTTGWLDMRFDEIAHNDSSPISLTEALTLFPESRRSRWIPGTRGAYSNTGPGVAAYVVEKVTGVPFESYVQEYFFEPLGMPTATYFQPDDYARRAAIPYMEGEPQDYWHIVYRPAGSINASPRAMAKLLQFFLQRGEFQGREILPAAAIERMETPKTTLANELGVTAGYGLANYTSGFKDFGIAFHGHNGGMAGAMSDFAYAPALNSGYALLVTGNPAGMRQISDAIREYLLRDQPKPELDIPPLPDTFADLNGIYTPINPRQERMRFIPAFLSAMKFSTDDQFVHRFPLAGGWESPSNDYALNDQVLIDQWSGLPTVALVQDPLAGDAVQVNTALYQEASTILVWGELLFFCSVFLLSALAVVYALVWAPLNLYHKNFRSSAVSIRLWPTLASLLLIGALVRTMFVTLVDLSALMAWSNLSVTLFVLTLGYGAASVWSAVNFVRLRIQKIKRRIRLPAITLTMLHLAMTIYLASYGMIGVRIWTW